MATATLGGRSKNRLTANQITERKQSATLADRKRMVQVEAARIGRELHIIPAIAPLPAESCEVRSAPNAKPMKREDIRNVERLSEGEEIALFKSLDQDATHTSGFAAGDSRWCLTPHELRRLRERPLQIL